MDWITPELTKKAQAYFLRLHGEMIDEERARQYIVSFAELFIILARIQQGQLKVWEEDQPARAQRGRRSS